MLDCSWCWGQQGDSENDQLYKSYFPLYLSDLEHILIGQISHDFLCSSEFHLRRKC